MTPDRDVESTRSEWQDIVGNERDSRDIRTLREEHGSMDIPPNYEFPAGSGLILRKGDKPLGYVLFDVSEKKDAPDRDRSLLIQHFYTSNEVRGIGSIRRILKLFRDQAEKRQCTRLILRPITPTEMYLTKRIGAKQEGRYYVIPVAQLDIETILGKV